MAEVAFEATLPEVRPGMTKRQVAAALTVHFLQAGSETELPFPPIVASSPNSCLPHAVPSHRRLEPDDLFLIDWGATVRGYISDLTRTFCLALVSAEWQRLHEIIAQANAAGREPAGPGAACADVAHATRLEDMLRARWSDWYVSAEDGYHLLREDTERVVAMGLSMGGVLALLMAARLPLAGVAAMSTPFFPPDPRMRR